LEFRRVLFRSESHPLPHHRRELCSEIFCFAPSCGHHEYRRMVREGTDCPGAGLIDARDVQLRLANVINEAFELGIRGGYLEQSGEHRCGWGHLNFFYTSV